MLTSFEVFIFSFLFYLIGGSVYAFRTKTFCVYPGMKAQKMTKFESILILVGFVGLAISMII